MHSTHALKLMLPPCAFLPACACPPALLPVCRRYGCLSNSKSDGRMAPTCTQPWWRPSAGKQASKQGRPSLRLPLPLSCCLAARPRLASEPPPALPLARAISSSYLLC